MKNTLDNAILVSLGFNYDEVQSLEKALKLFRVSITQEIGLKGFADNLSFFVSPHEEGLTLICEFEPNASFDEFLAKLLVDTLGGCQIILHGQIYAKLP